MSQHIKTIIISLTVLSSLHAFESQAQQPPVNIRPPKTPIFEIVPPDALNLKKPKLPDTQIRTLPKKPKFRLPPVDTTQDKDPRLSTAFKIFVKQIQITGNTVFTEQELQQITLFYENRVITNEELQTLRHQLTRYYIDHGYINSGITLPDQEIKNGLIQFQVIEGELSDLNITGNNWLKSSYINDRMVQSFDPPLNIKEIQSRWYWARSIQKPLLMYNSEHDIRPNR